VARIDLKMQIIAGSGWDDKAVDQAMANDQFTMAVEKNPSGGGILKMMWAGIQFQAPFTVQK